MARHAYDVARFLKRQGSEPCIIALDDAGVGKKSESIFPKLFRLRGVTPQKAFQRYYYNLWKMFRAGFSCCLRNRIKVILANSWTLPGITAFLLHKVFGIPYMIFAHGLELHNPQKSKRVAWLMSRVLGDASRVIAISSYTCQRVQEYVPAACVRIIPPFIDTKRFAAEKIVPDKRLSNKRVLLTVGRLVAHKGQDIVIKALSRIRAQCPDIVYCIVGSGPYEEALRQAAVFHGVADSVVFAGEVPDNELAAYYASCEVFLGVSRYIEKTGEVEGFGIVFLEAAACSKPAIAGRSGGIADAVVDGETGLLVDPESSEEVAAAVIRLCNDKEFARRLGQQGKKRVEEEFSLDSFTRKFTEVMHEAGIE